MIDLHMHTTASDGSDSPEQLLEAVRQAGIHIFSVTDHDSTAACREIQKLISEVRAESGRTEENCDPEKTKTGEQPRFINGVEFSCEDEEGKYHILGYAYKPEDSRVVQLTEETHRMRMNKLELRISYLRETYGFVFPEHEIKKLRALNNPGKPHIGNLMVKLGYAPDRSTAIEKYLNPFSPPNGHIRPEEAIRAILADSGIPVLAHPIYGDGDQLILGEELEARIRKLQEFGLKGLECFYSGFVPKEQKLMLQLADQFDLYVTAGSDYHGTNKLISLGDTGLEAEPDAVPRLEAFLEAALARG